MLDQTVLDRVEMDVIEMAGEIPLVADCVLPIAALPDTAFAAAGHSRRSRFDGRQRLGERDLDRAPAAGEVGVAFWQAPQAMHVVGEHDPGIDTKRSAGSPNGVAERIDVPNQKIRAPVQQIDREKEGSARDPVAAIVRHGQSMPGLAARRNALRCSALRLWYQALDVDQ